MKADHDRRLSRVAVRVFSMGSLTQNRAGWFRRRDQDRGVSALHEKNADDSRPFRGEEQRLSNHPRGKGAIDSGPLGNIE